MLEWRLSAPNTAAMVLWNLLPHATTAAYYFLSLLVFLHNWSSREYSGSGRHSSPLPRSSVLGLCSKRLQKAWGVEVVGMWRSSYLPLTLFCNLWQLWMNQAHPILLWLAQFPKGDIHPHTHNNEEGVAVYKWTTTTTAFALETEMEDFKPFFLVICCGVLDLLPIRDTCCLFVTIAAFTKPA